MEMILTSAAQISKRLAPLKGQQLQRLADLSGVPFHTLLKIKTGETKNPGVDTVIKFLPHIETAAVAV